MPKEEGSLLHGSGTEPLDDRRQREVVSTFYYFDRTANAKYDGGRTRFRPLDDPENPEINHEILFGPDIYPGPNLADPNSCLSLRGAVVHELTHKARHDDATEINALELEHIDEALTSLSAILRFQRKLEDHDIFGLVADAVQRLQKFANEHTAEVAED